MVKRILTMALVVAVLFSLSLSASARWDGADQCSVSLSFWGSTASCSASITANERTAKVTASISLYRVNSNGTFLVLQSCLQEQLPEFLCRKRSHPGQNRR